MVMNTFVCVCVCVFRDLRHFLVMVLLMLPKSADSSNALQLILVLSLPFYIESLGRKIYHTEGFQSLDQLLEGARC